MPVAASVVDDATRTGVELDAGDVVVGVVLGDVVGVLEGAEILLITSQLYGVLSWTSASYK